MKLITVYREEPVHPGGPSSMDVQEQDLDGCLALGWRVVDTADDSSTSNDATEDDMGNKPKPKPKPKR